MRFRNVVGPLASLTVGYLTLFHLNVPWQFSALAVGIAAGLLSSRLSMAAASSLAGASPFVAVLAVRVSDAAGIRLLEIIASVAGLPPFAVLGLLTLSYVGISVASASIVNTVVGLISSHMRKVR